MFRKPASKIIELQYFLKMHLWMIWFKLKVPVAEEGDEEGCVLVFGNKQLCFEAVKKELKLKIPQGQGEDE